MLNARTILPILLIGLVFFCSPARADAELVAGKAVHRVVVYGATGRVGSRVVAEATNRGHNVIAVSRRQGAETVQGDVVNSQSVSAIIQGADAVVVSVRGSADGSKDPQQAIQRVAAEVIVEVLREIGSDAPRLIFVGGAGSLEVEPGITYANTLGRMARAMMPASIEQEIDGQVLALEYLRTVDDVRWTYISPAKKFGPGKRTGSYRTGGDTMLFDGKGKSRISMEDFAMALVDELENAAHVGERISVAY